MKTLHGVEVKPEHYGFVFARVIKLIRNPRMFQAREKFTNKCEISHLCLDCMQRIVEIVINGLTERMTVIEKFLEHLDVKLTPGFSPHKMPF